MAVYTDIMRYELFAEQQVLGGSDILPGLEISLGQVFAELDRHRPE